jgi:hypothetical protein
MLRFLLVSIISFQFLSSQGQITKHNWLVGGGANFSNSRQKIADNTDHMSLTALSVLPNVGYFMVDKFAVGFGASVTLIQSKANSIKSNVTSYKVGPFARYYFLDTEQTANLFLQGNFNYGITRFNNTGNPMANSKNFSYSIIGGPVVYFNNSVGLEFTVGWNYDKAIDDNYHVNSIVMGIGFQIHLEK